MPQLLARYSASEQRAGDKTLLTGALQALPMIIQKRTLGWLPKPSLYNEQASNRAKLKSGHQQFLSNQTSLSSSISSIQSNYTAELTNIVSRVALERLGYAWVPGCGRDPAGVWPGEASVLVPGMGLAEATAIARRFAQNAVVWSAADARPQLVLLR